MADEQPASGLLLVTLNTLVTWLLVGSVIAWRIKPRAS